MSNRKLTLLPLLVSVLVLMIGVTGTQGVLKSVQARDESQDTVRINAREYQFKPSRITLPAQTTVTVIFTNTGELSHNLIFGKIRARSRTIPSGRTDTLSISTAGPDTLTYWCGVVGHRDAGMEGEAIVVQQSSK